MSIEEMKQIDIRTADPSTLADRRTIRIDPTLPKKEGLKEYLRQIKNPYCYRDGNVVVKVSFRENGHTMEECLEAYLRSL